MSASDDPTAGRADDTPGLGPSAFELIEGDAEAPSPDALVELLRWLEVQDYRSWVAWLVRTSPPAFEIWRGIRTVMEATGSGPEEAVALQATADVLGSTPDWENPEEVCTHCYELRGEATYRRYLEKVAAISGQEVRERLQPVLERLSRLLPTMRDRSAKVQPAS